MTTAPKTYRSNRAAKAAARKALGPDAVNFVHFSLIPVSEPGNPEGWTWKPITAGAEMAK